MSRKGAATSSWDKNKMGTHESGRTFERWVMTLYEELGKLRVMHDITLQKQTRQGKIRSQIDVTYGLIKKTYIECKYHDNEAKVTFEDVAKFGEKLKLHRINYRQGIMVTNTGYDIRAQAYARKKHLTLIDRHELVKMDWRRSHQLHAMITKPPRRFAQDLETRIRTYRG